MAATVGYQSTTCIMPAQLVFLTAALSSGELIIATPRTPPCHSVHFDPRRGQLLPASRYFPELVAPPLSVVRTIIELSYIPASESVSTTFPTPVSSAVTIAIIVRRFGFVKFGWSANASGGDSSGMCTTCQAR